jgi:hypothetical protein
MDAERWRARAAVVDRERKVEVEAGLAAEGNRSSQREERCFLLTDGMKQHITASVVR